MADAICQSCMEEGEVERSMYFLFHCPARLKLEHIGSLKLDESEDIAETDISRS